MRLSLKAKPYAPAYDGKWFPSFAILPVIIGDQFVWLEKIEVRFWEGGAWWKQKMEYRLPQ